MLQHPLGVGLAELGALDHGMPQHQAAVTGEVDYITDGQRTRAVTGGDPLMARVVGTGCALSAVVAAAAAMPGDRLENVAAACGLMKLAGGKAALQGGPGSFTPAFLDALYAGGDL
ncbi:MAG: hydroxyethylthiazole kinase [Bradyrhizobium sp.]|nr:hydroxyethylthiazole kinase [Bradyrhizobium sp.]